MSAQYDVVVLGAGAAGMMAAIEAGKRGRAVLVVEHTDKPGEKIRISGGGRCNFTNTRTAPSAFLSANRKFAISALKRYAPADFIALVDRHGIAHHEKTLGQLFCDGPATQIIAMLIAEMKAAGVVLSLGTQVDGIAREGEGFSVALSTGDVTCRSLIVATGGKSIPKMGATGYAYEVARQFEVPVIETRPALVPLTFDPSLLSRTAALSGVSVDGRVSHGKTAFEEAVLFTHRGVSGPAILQISSFWRQGEAITLDLAPGVDLFAALRAARQTQGRQGAQTVLSHHLPKRLAQATVQEMGVDRPLGDLSDARLRALADAFSAWSVKPVGSEGYRTAEVTLGGIDTNALDARTMAVKAVPGLYFVGEAVDVTGWLGGYNFQWAWSSGWAAGQVA